MLDERIKDVKVVYLVLMDTSSLSRIRTLRNPFSFGVSAFSRSIFTRAVAAMTDGRADDGNVVYLTLYDEYFIIEQDPNPAKSFRLRSVRFWSKYVHHGSGHDDGREN